MTSFWKGKYCSSANRIHWKQEEKILLKIYFTLFMRPKNFLLFLNPQSNTDSFGRSYGTANILYSSHFLIHIPRLLCNLQTCLVTKDTLWLIMSPARRWMHWEMPDSVACPDTRMFHKLISDREKPTEGKYYIWYSENKNNG